MSKTRCSSSPTRATAANANRSSVIGNINSWISDLNLTPLFQSLSNPFRRRNSKSGSASAASSPLSSPHIDNKRSIWSPDSNEKIPAKFLNGTLMATIKPKEIIELANFGVVEVDNCEKGVGHNFKVVELKNATWCDCCSEFMWTPVVYNSEYIPQSPSKRLTNTIQCANCKYTCHFRCRKLVRIDCQGTKETAEILKPSSEELRSKSPLFFEPCGLQQKIEKYNEKLKQRGSGLGMTLMHDNTFRGFLRVHLNLTRPINVVAGTRPPSIYDIINDEELTASRRTLTTFYMPRDTVKNIHITSENTSLDVIKAMMKKFKVVDNPQKFALYQQYPENNNQVIKRIGDFEKPLRITLEWYDSDEKRFVLQENDTGDIAWEAFQLPELKNFIKILDREENDHLSQVKLKYDMLRPELQRLIALKTIQSEGLSV
ncbi:Ras association domain-containing protein 1-like protein [Leptotrombidium deliense]|uniref:Ras association domain-containing protein 1-like protein n=1 Tax=Leptotrombidium deliense TaxID=299467 RepID=A0A443S4Y4_9ACAR|nr:Ras association domain-containing protein 1-like protein [Leptotrombidium deliense]